MASVTPQSPDDDLFDLDFTAPGAIEATYTGVQKRADKSPPEEKPSAPAALSLEPLVAAVATNPAAVADTAVSLAPVAPTPVSGSAATPRDFTPLEFEPVALPAGVKPVAAAPIAATVKPSPPRAAAKPPPVEPAKPKDPLADAALAAAEGRPAEAMKWLSGDLPADKVEFAWRMLFELDQRLGRRDLFEQRALAFASRLEKSPPTWIEEESGGPLANAGGGGAAAISLSGALVARAAEPLRKLVEVAEQRPSVKLDLSRLKEVDDEGARLLLDALKALSKKGKECTLQGASHAIDIATAKLRLGERENESIWLLVLELLQCAHRADRFDDWAVNYAVTFEVSPPAYLPPPSDQSSDAQSTQRNTTSGWPLSGEWIKEDEAAFAALEQEVMANSRITTLDASELQRMDLASARALQRVLKRLAEAGRPLVLNNVGYLQFPLLLMAGIPEADLTLRKQ